MDIVKAIKHNYDVSVSLNNTNQGLLIKQENVFSEDSIIKKRIRNIIDKYVNIQKDIRQR